MRLRSLQDGNEAAPGNEMFERPTSERSQASTSNRGGNDGGMVRNASRRSLVEPLRAGEEIYSPPVRPATALATRPGGFVRPPVPVEPLAPVPEEIQPSVGMQASRINPVPHVELQ